MSLAEDIRAEQLLTVPSPGRDRRRGLVLPVARVTTLAPTGAVCRVESTDATQCGWVEPDSPNGLPPDVVAWLETAPGQRFRIPDELVPWAVLVISSGITSPGKIEFCRLPNGRLSAEFRP